MDPTILALLIGLGHAPTPANYVPPKDMDRVPQCTGTVHKIPDVPGGWISVTNCPSDMRDAATLPVDVDRALYALKSAADQERMRVAQGYYQTTRPWGSAGPAITTGDGGYYSETSRPYGPSGPTIRSQDSPPPRPNYLNDPFKPHPLPCVYYRC